METVVLSDIHLADAEIPDPRRPLWKAFKQREHFIDGDMAKLLAWLMADAAGPMELVLNGDIFDFDAVCKLPDPPPSPIHWLQRLRGLGAQEWMSNFKMDCIVADHQAIYKFNWV